MSALALPVCDLRWLRRRVSNFAEDRPGVYRMLSPAGRVMYVGKAKRVRTRLLSYFRAPPEEKAARILHAAGDIQWEYASSEFAALLKELRQIQRFRPVFNVRMNRRRRAVLIKISGGDAPKIFVGSTPGSHDIRHYGPFTSAARAEEAVKVLNDLLMLRDCALSMPITFAEQGDLFGSGTRAACLRHDFGTCLGPCAGFVSEEAYRRRVRVAVDFLEGRTIAPIDRVVTEMNMASEANSFERAARWRDRLDAMEWLLQATVSARSAIDALTFVYFDTGTHGDDRAYVIRRATVRAVAPAPHTPIEREAFRAVVRQHTDPEPSGAPLPLSSIDEMLILMRWFKRHPAAMRSTMPITEWLVERDTPPASGRS